MRKRARKSGGSRVRERVRAGPRSPPRVRHTLLPACTILPLLRAPIHTRGATCRSAAHPQRPWAASSAAVQNATWTVKLGAAVLAHATWRSASSVTVSGCVSRSSPPGSSSRAGPAARLAFTARVPRPVCRAATSVSSLGDSEERPPNVMRLVQVPSGANRAAASCAPALTSS
eukprot:887386-Prorocentrum_minimum.AAC.1